MTLFGLTLRLVRFGKRPVVTVEWGTDRAMSVSPDDVTANGEAFAGWCATVTDNREESYA